MKNTEAKILRKKEMKVMSIIDKLHLLVDSLNYDFDNNGHIVNLEIYGIKELRLDFFPKWICELRLLRRLVFTGHEIRRVPNCIRNLTNLVILDLSNNRIQKLPSFISDLHNLKEFYLADKTVNLPNRNLLEFINLADFKGGIYLKDILLKYKKMRKRELDEREGLIKKYRERQEPWEVIYPPKEILRSPQNYEYIILWMLKNNFACKWGHFREKPINMNQHLIWKYINTLSHYNLIYKVNGAYMITELGKKKLFKIEKSKN